MSDSHALEAEPLDAEALLEFAERIETLPPDIAAWVAPLFQECLRARIHEAELAAELIEYQDTPQNNGTVPLRKMAQIALDTAEWLRTLWHVGYMGAGNFPAQPRSKFPNIELEDVLKSALFARIREGKKYDEQDLWALLDQQQQPFLLILDGVTDPQNLGALIRSTYVLGGHGILLPMNHSASVTASTAKASAGASERLPIAQLPNLVRSLVELRRMDYQIVAAVAPGAGGQRPWQIDLRRPTVFVLGSEGRGMRPMVLKTGTHRVEVPMQPGLRGASLNVSAAGAILLYEALSQRREQPATMAHATPTP